MKKTYNKLIRDRISEIIENAGHKSKIRILDDDEYVTYLSKKLQEEVDEFQESMSLEELADIMEVVFALAAAQGKTPEDMEALRVDKREKRGGFEKRFFLEWVDKKDVE
jgi:predicted house-cleaning noncanonical NTP pyrophosphatase (MazG superfamily)